MLRSICTAIAILAIAVVAYLQVEGIIDLPVEQIARNLSEHSLLGGATGVITVGLLVWRLLAGNSQRWENLDLFKADMKTLRKTVSSLKKDIDKRREGDVQLTEQIATTGDELMACEESIRRHTEKLHAVKCEQLRKGSDFDKLVKNRTQNSKALRKAENRLVTAQSMLEKRLNRA